VVAGYFGDSIGALKSQRNRERSFPRPPPAGGRDTGGAIMQWMLGLPRIGASVNGATG
jgi:hypothetical protein